MSREDLVDYELFDIEDIEFEMRHSKSKNSATLTLSGERTIGLMRYYLALKKHVDQIELSLNIMKEDDGEH